MFTFLLIVQTLIAASMVGVILMQRSEGGGLGVGSSSAGLMTARGAADFLTRATAVLATLFIVLSIGLAAMATVRTAPTKIDTSLAKSGPSRSTALPGSVPLAGGDPLAGAATAAAATNGVAPAAARPAPARPQNQGVPLAR